MKLAIFMNFKKSETSDPYILLLNFIANINIKKNYKCVNFLNFSFYNTWKNTKNLYKNKKLKRSAPTWNKEFELPDGSYSIPDVQDYFEYILKRTWRKD